MTIVHEPAPTEHVQIVFNFDQARSAARQVDQLLRDLDGANTAADTIKADLAEHEEAAGLNAAKEVLGLARKAALERDDDYTAAKESLTTHKRRARKEGATLYRQLKAASTRRTAIMDELALAQANLVKGLVNASK